MSVIAAKLDEARALIEKGWCQHDFTRCTLDDRKCFCVAGAVNMAVAADPYSETVSEDYFAPLMRVVGATESYGLANWNDAPERTKAEVIEAFRKAAELARQEQSA